MAVVVVHRGCVEDAEVVVEAEDAAGAVRVELEVVEAVDGGGGPI